MPIHSDSDEEQRFTEAAVSAETILSGSAIAPIEKFKENHFKSTNFKDVDETLSAAQRRRRRKKRKDSDDNGQICSQKASDHASETVMPRKKRKK